MIESDKEENNNNQNDNDKEFDLNDLLKIINLETNDNLWKND